MSNIHASIIDSASYTKAELAKAVSRNRDWVERNIMYPSDPTTRKPLCRCNDCGAEFPFPDPVRCPECESADLDIVRGAPWRKIGGEITFSGREVRLWIEQHSHAPLRESWGRYLEKLAAAKEAAKAVQTETVQ